MGECFQIAMFGRPESGSDEQKGPVRMARGGLAQQVEIKPRRDRAKVSNDGAVDGWQVGRDLFRWSREMCKVSGVGDPPDGLRGKGQLLLEGAGGHDQSIGVFGETSFQKGHGRVIGLESLVVVHAIVENSPTALAQGESGFRPERQLYDGGCGRDPFAPGQFPQRSDQRFPIRVAQRIGIDVAWRGHPRLDPKDIVLDPRELRGGSGVQMSAFDHGSEVDPEDSMAASSERPHQLLGPLEAKIPVDDRKAQDVDVCGEGVEIARGVEQALFGRYPRWRFGRQTDPPAQSGANRVWDVAPHVLLAESQEDAPESARKSLLRHQLLGYTLRVPRSTSTFSGR